MRLQKNVVTSSIVWMEATRILEPALLASKLKFDTFLLNLKLWDVHLGFPGLIAKGSSLRILNIVEAKLSSMEQQNVLRCPLRKTR